MAIDWPSYSYQQQYYTGFDYASSNVSSHTVVTYITTANTGNYWYYGYEAVDEIIDPVAEEENILIRTGRYKLRSSGRVAEVEMYNYDSVTVKFLDDKSEVIVPTIDFDNEFIKM